MPTLTIETTARGLLSQGYGFAELEAIVRALEEEKITPSRAIAFAQELSDAMAAIFTSEIAPLISSDHPAEDSCYSPCGPKVRCTRDFGFGVEVLHAGGERWTVAGRAFAHRSDAEFFARRCALLIRLRSELQRESRPFHRQKWVSAT
jgi:hypothetical protein